VAAVAAVAGGDEMGGMGGRGGMGGGMEMGSGVMARKPTKAEQFADKLKLTKEQRDETATIFAAALERSVSVRADLDERRAKIAGALIDAKPAEEVNKLAADYAAVAAQMTKIQAEAFAKVYATLKPNQQAKAGQAFELMAGMFSSPGSRPRGPGGMGGGAGRSRGAGR
jgi:Spy/CpxP family protein refolding chaperone